MQIVSYTQNREREREREREKLFFLNLIKNAELANPKIGARALAFSLSLYSCDIFVETRVVTVMGMR
jgi:hypothetical protein